MSRYLFSRVLWKCKEVNIFGNIYNCKKIPIEFKIMACLRILGRDSCLDDITDFIGMPMETVRSMFHKFIDGVATKLFPGIVSFPTGNELEEVMRKYESLGFPGCIGSIDCTHIAWDRSPTFMLNATKGKESYPSLSFEAVVGRSGKVYHLSNAFAGAVNDVTISRNDDAIVNFPSWKSEKLEEFFLELV